VRGVWRPRGSGRFGAVQIGDPQSHIGDDSAAMSGMSDLSFTHPGLQGNLRAGTVWSSVVCLALAALLLLVRFPDVVPPLPVWVVGLLEEGEPTSDDSMTREPAGADVPEETGLPLQSTRGPLAPEGFPGGSPRLESVPRTRDLAPPTGAGDAPSRNWRPFVQEAPAGTLTGEEGDWYAVEGPLRFRAILASPAPGYPPGVQIEGTVRVHVRVAPSGEVIAAYTVERGDASLDNAAVASLYQWRFAPLPNDAAQVVQEGDVTFVFRLTVPAR
jgi:TonB family protein